jgi:hypothetical protein
MPTLLLTIADKIAISAMQAASAKEMTLDEYVEWCLRSQLNQTNEALLIDSKSQRVEELAKQLFKSALVPNLFTPNDPYLVEAIYKRLRLPEKWEDLDRGFRIMVGKAFKREVEAQSKDSKKRVEFFKKNQQNQALYKTVIVS